MLVAINFRLNMDDNSRLGCAECDTILPRGARPLDLEHHVRLAHRKRRGRDGSREREHDGRKRDRLDGTSEATRRGDEEISSPSGRGSTAGARTEPTFRPPQSTSGFYGREEDIGNIGPPFNLRKKATPDSSRSTHLYSARGSERPGEAAHVRKELSPEDKK